MKESDPSQKAFEAAKKAFKRDLKDDKLYEDILRTDSIDKLYEAIEQLQEKQDNERRLRRIGKMKSITDKLQSFNNALDTYTQVDPEIMALVWGSIRVLLVLTDNVAKLADAVITAMEDISDALPFFTDVAKLFHNNDKLRDKLALFYGDIIQFYTIAFNFFNLSKRKLIFEAVWPKQKPKIALLVSHIERHTASMRNEMTFHHIREEHELRVKAMNQFDKETEFQDKQKFHALRSRVAATNYEDRLDWLLNRLSDGSVNWLNRDRTFLDWLDVSNPGPQLLWLQGIPGAGKTYLAAATIKETMAQHQTLFAFPSHIHRSSTTARSILQSLLFQLASHSKDIQSALVESEERDLVGSTSKISDTFKTVLKDAGPTYIIIDGLDEMDSDERRILLEQLCRLDECSQVRLLISSRPEDDIGNFLGKKSAGILVHKNNWASIQVYVNRRIQTWMDGANFVQPAREKIWHMLAPLAATAAGMFLYARIVLDNAERLTNLEEIERELHVLPESLDEVYHRIFSRIDNLPRALRRKVKRIFNWIACAPVPMTSHEMEQMLDITSARDAAPPTLNSVNFVGICGAAVEVVDETPRFVHFTVNEYIFSRQVADFGNKAEANLSLTKSTLKYLCSGIFDEDVSDDKLDQNILDGKYRLHWFAFSLWISLVKSCLQDIADLTDHPDLLELLCRLALERRNYRFEGTVSLKDAIFQKLEPEWPEIVHIACGVLQFRQHDHQPDWNYHNMREWVDKDPSVMSSMWARIYNRFTALLCSQRGHHETKCHCVTLKRSYGTRVFKCMFPSCSLSRYGFPTDKDRNLHMKRDNHSRPWKCSTQGCEYSTIGFSTKTDKYNHWKTRHRNSNPESAGPTSFRHGDELQVLLFELTKSEDVEGLQNLALNMVPDSTVPDYIICPAILLAATKGSLPMVDILSEWTDGWSISWATRWNRNNQFWPENREFYSAIMKGNNPDLLLWFLERLLLRRQRDHGYYGWLAGDAVATGSPDMYTAWENFLLDPDRGLKIAYPWYTGDADAVLNGGRTTEQWVENDGSIGWKSHLSTKEHYRRSPLFSGSAFGAARKNALYETRLIQTWHKLINNVLGGRPLDKRFLGCALLCLAKSRNPSITIGAELLRLGAPIDFPRVVGSNVSKSEAGKIESVVGVSGGGQRRHGQKREKGMTALHWAARQRTEQSSHFLRFLLEKGADPEYAWAHKEPSKEPGVALMKKWLGETWEEVVDKTKEARARKEQFGKLNYGDAGDDDQDEDFDDSGDGGDGQADEASEDDQSEDDSAETSRSAEQRDARAAKRRKLH